MKPFFFVTIALLTFYATTPALCEETEDDVQIELRGPEPVDRVTIGGELFTQQVRGTTKQYGKSRLPFFFPIIGPTGAAMTRNYPVVEAREGESKDHPHHQSLWLAHGNVNGVDFWHDKKVSIEPQHLSGSDRLELDPATGEAWIADKHHWNGPDGKTILVNELQYIAHMMGDKTRFIELKHHLAPAEGVDKVTFGDTKEGTMAIRTHPALRLRGKVATGKAINSEGVTGKAVWGKRAKWVAYWGVIDGETCGVAIFDHPTNLRHPTWWHARDYGLVAANPFGISDFERGKHKRGAGDFTLKQGESLNLRYRFVFFAGTAEEAKIAEKYEQWVESTTSPAADQEAGWTPLFNGKDLTGWSAKPGGEWEVVDGAIVGTSEASEKRHGLLVSEKAYGDFEARLKFKVTSGDSGFYFRSTPVDHFVGIKGFQAEVDRTFATGGLYETLGRAWVKKPDAGAMKKLYQPGEWTDMKVRAIGGDISVTVNGQVVTELNDDPGAAKGHFALQLHGGQDMHVAYKDIDVREIND